MGMEVSLLAAKAAELDASNRVLHNQRSAEILDLIMQNMELKTLLVCRKVCRHWRSVSMMSLKRQIQTADAERHNCYHFLQKSHEKSYKRSRDPDASDPDEPQEFYESQMLWICQKPYHRHRIIKSPTNTLIKLRIGDATIRQKGGPQNEHEYMKPVHLTPWFTATALELDWLSSVSELHLMDCLTVGDWNAAGKGILKKFTCLVTLDLHCSKLGSTVLPLCYAELKNAELDLFFPSVKKVKVSYFGNSREEKSPVVTFDLDFLVRCKNLESFGGTLMYDYVSKQEFCAYVNIGKLAEDGGEAWIMELYDDGRRIAERKPSESFCDRYSGKYSNVIAQDVANLIGLAQPRVLEMTMRSEVLENLKSSATEKTQILALDHTSMNLQSPFEVLPVLSRTCNFSNLKRLTWKWSSECYMSFKKDSPGSNNSQKNECKPIFPNLTSLHLFQSEQPFFISGNDKSRKKSGALPKYTRKFSLLDTLREQKIDKLAPNTQVLVANYFIDGIRKNAGVKFREKLRKSCRKRAKKGLNRVLRLAKSFCNLKHLVLLIKQNGTGKIASHVELTRAEVECLQGLVSLTVIVDKVSALEGCSNVFRRACAMVPSMKSLGIYWVSDDSSDSEPDNGSGSDPHSRDPSGSDSSSSPQHRSKSASDGSSDSEEKIETLPLTFPKHVTLNIGPVERLIGKAVFEGVEDSFINWEDIMNIKINRWQW